MLVSAVVVTFNSSSLIRSCLDSLYRQTVDDLEIILVDNGSSDGTASLVEGSYPDIRIVRNRENKGACQARNQGIESSRGEWVLVLDNDSVLSDDFLSTVCSRIPALRQDIGILQPTIIGSHNEYIYSRGIYLSWFRRFYDIDYGKSVTVQTRGSRSLFGACAACCIYRRAMLDEIKEDMGYFDERFFFLVEDVDLSWRARRKGWMPLYLPEALAYHKGNSSCLDPKLKQYLCFRNRFLTIKKNEGIFRYLKKTLPLLLYDLPRLCCLLIMNPYMRKGTRGLEYR